MPFIIISGAGLILPLSKSYGEKGTFSENMSRFVVMAGGKLNEKKNKV